MKIYKKRRFPKLGGVENRRSGAEADLSSGAESVGGKEARADPDSVGRERGLISPGREGSWKRRATKIIH